MSYRINEIKDRNIDELLGISRGILADGIVNKEEAVFLLDWIKTHFDNFELQTYPLSTIYHRLKKVLSDNKLDEEEANEIKELMQNFTGGKPLTEQVKSMSSTLPLCSPLPKISFNDCVFCLTGAFTIGTRKQCEIIIKELGGSVSKNPIFKTNYLVIGILGSDEWIHSSYGRKIERAIELRDIKNTGLNIVTEEHFIKFI